MAGAGLWAVVLAAGVAMAAACNQVCVNGDGIQTCSGECSLCLPSVADPAVFRCQPPPRCNDPCLSDKQCSTIAGTGCTVCRANRCVSPTPTTIPTTTTTTTTATTTTTTTTSTTTTSTSTTSTTVCRTACSQDAACAQGGAACGSCLETLSGANRVCEAEYQPPLDPVFQRGVVQTTRLEMSGLLTWLASPNAYVVRYIVASGNTERIQPGNMTVLGTVEALPPASGPRGATALQFLVERGTRRTAFLYLIGVTPSGAMLSPPRVVPTSQRHHFSYPVFADLSGIASMALIVLVLVTLGGVATILGTTHLRKRRRRDDGSSAASASDTSSSKESSMTSKSGASWTLQDLAGSKPALLFDVDASREQTFRAPAAAAGAAGVSSSPAPPKYETLLPLGSMATSSSHPHQRGIGFLGAKAASAACGDATAGTQHDYTQLELQARLQAHAPQPTAATLAALPVPRPPSITPAPIASALRHSVSARQAGRASTDLHFQELYKHIARGDIDVLESFFSSAEHGSNLNLQDQFGNSALHLAVQLQQAPIVRWLLKHGAEPNVMTHQFQTPLHIMTSKQREFETLVTAFIHAGANLQAQDSDLATPLLTAVQRNDVQAVRCLLSHNADCNLGDARGMTPLMTAVALLHREAFGLLLPRTEANCEDVQGWTALHWAVAVEDQEAVRRILGLADLCVIPQVQGSETALHVAVRNGSTALVNCILEATPDDNVLRLLFSRSRNAHTPMDVAVMSQNQAIEAAFEARLRELCRIFSCASKSELEAKALQWEALEKKRQYMRQMRRQRADAAATPSSAGSPATSASSPSSEASGDVVSSV